MALSPGIRLGPYEILSPLGAGGMGEVYRAHDTRLGRDVAVKVLPEEFARDPERLRRFELEARAVATLSHPNILILYDIGTHDGAPYLVTELLEGESMRHRLRSGALGTARVVDFGVQIAHGLAAAHDKGIVHRDLKPENLFVTKDRQVKILDFGLARLRAGDEAAAIQSQAPTSDRLTGQGRALGTVGYMAPEQVRGLPADARSDLFAFGCVLYEMVSGRQAFSRETSAETMTAILREEPPELGGTGRSVPPGLERVVRRCLEKEPGHRFQSASDLAFALEAVTQTSTSGGTLAPALGARPRAVRRLAAAAAAAALLGAAGAGLYRLGRDSAEPALPTFRQLTFQRGRVASARFSPDGNTVYYSAQWGSRPMEIYAQRLDSGTSLALGVRDGEIQAISSGEMAVVLRQVVNPYQDNLLGGVLGLVPLTGGEPRPVHDDVKSADYAPGTADPALVFVRGSDNVLEFPVGTSLHRERLMMTQPRFSPSGESLAFIGTLTDYSRGGEVIVVDRKGTKRSLTQGLGVRESLAWRRDGKAIFFTRRGELGAVDLAGKVRVLSRMPQRMVLMDVAPDGTLLAAQERRRLGNVGLLAGDRAQRELGYMDKYSASWISPDGTSVAFEDRGGVYLQKADGSPPVRLGEGMGGCLSPDGRWAAVMQGEATRLLPTGTGSPITLPAGTLTSSTWCAWFPDGKRLLLTGTEEGKGWSMYVQDVPQGLPRIIAEGIGMATGAAISPDGRWVAAYVLDKPREHHKLYPVEGGAPREIPGLAPGDHPVAFSDDGRHLFLVEQPYGPPIRVVRLDLKTGRREPWWTVSPSDPAGYNGIYNMQITGNGKYYTLSYFQVLSDLFLVQGVQ